MTEKAGTKSAAPGFVVLHQVGKDRWQFLGEVRRKRGLPARAARTQAIMAATGGKAKNGEVYAAVLRSEWRIAMDWVAPDA
jgi:predicted esterase